jgi:hypothetical protein
MPMMNNEQNTQNPQSLSSWLRTVHNELAIRRVETRSVPRPKRNRERERARREARQLFAEFYAEQAIQGALS